MLQDRRRKADRPLDRDRSDARQAAGGWAELGYIWSVYARYVDTFGKGPGVVVDRGTQPRMGGSDGYDSEHRREEKRQGSNGQQGHNVYT